MAPIAMILIGLVAYLSNDRGEDASLMRLVPGERGG
jgi:hypothetical protein